MKQHFRIVLIFILFVMILIGFQTVSAEIIYEEQSGKLKHQSQDMEVFSELSDYTDSFYTGYAADPFSMQDYTPKDIKNIDDQDFSLPSSFDAREMGWITPVKNQFPFGTCWGHTAMNLAESNLIRKGYSNSTLNLSELQLHYFLWHKVPDPLNLISEDKNLWFPYEYEKGKRYYWIDSGLTAHRGLFLLSTWIGPTFESAAPYPSPSANIHQIRLHDSLAYQKTVAYLDNAIVVPFQNINAVKKNVILYGSAMIAYHNSFNPNYYRKEKASFFCPDKKYPSHFASIIGWDDAYPAGRFSQVPPGDGAWLIKNSFGTDFGKDGFFWLSYYDESLYKDAFFYGFEPKKKNQRNYQYDGSLNHDTISFPDSNEVLAANVFTSQNDESLTAAAFATNSHDFKYEIRVFTDLEDDANPESGKLEMTIRGRKNYSGYYTIPFPYSISLQKGTRFSVVIRITTEQVGRANIFTDTSFVNKVKNYRGEKVTYLQFISSSHPKESFYYSKENGWTDCYDENEEYNLGNVRIKAFTMIKTGNPKSLLSDTMESNQEFLIFDQTEMPTSTSKSADPILFDQMDVSKLILPSTGF